MKTLFTILFVIFLSSNVAIAQKCKPADKHKDDFTGVTYNLWGGKIDNARQMLRGTSQEFHLYLTNMDSKSIIYFIVTYIQRESDASVNKIEFPKGTKFRLKTSENEILEFTAEKSENAKRRFQHIYSTIFNLSAEISNEDIEKLMNSTLTMYQLEPEESESMQGEISSKTAEKIQKQIKCFSEI